MLLNGANVSFSINIQGISIQHKTSVNTYAQAKDLKNLSAVKYHWFEFLNWSSLIKPLIQIANSSTALALFSKLPLMSMEVLCTEQYGDWQGYQRSGLQSHIIQLPVVALQRASLEPILQPKSNICSYCSGCPRNVLHVVPIPAGLGPTIHVVSALDRLEWAPCVPIWQMQVPPVRQPWTGWS